MSSNSETHENLPIENNLLGHNLSELIKQHGINLTQLSQLLNIPMMTIRRLITGETGDPRLSTLKIIADHFNVSIDSLINDTPSSLLMGGKKNKACVVPKINWEVLSELPNTQLSALTQHWESVFLNEAASPHSFALESKPSLYPRFPQGTVFVIDPDVLPKDGDIVLIKFKDCTERKTGQHTQISESSSTLSPKQISSAIEFPKKSNEFSLKELFIDPPQWHLSSLVADTLRIDFNPNLHEIIGVVVMTLLYNSRE